MRSRGVPREEDVAPEAARRLRAPEKARAVAERPEEGRETALVRGLAHDETRTERSERVLRARQHQVFTLLDVDLDEVHAVDDTRRHELVQRRRADRDAPARQEISV